MNSEQYESRASAPQTGTAQPTAQPAAPPAAQPMNAPTAVPQPVSAPSATAQTVTTPGEWHRVSGSYAWADLVLNLLLAAVVGGVAAFILYVVSDTQEWWQPLLWGAVVLALVINALFAFRRVKAIGYVLREDDLLFRRGILFERVVAVPYGRLQLVDVTRGPVLRALGLATLKFVTASAATGVNLPGLRHDDAEALRDRLIALAEVRRSGL